MAKQHYREGSGSFSKTSLPRHTKYSRTIRGLGILEIVLGLSSIGIGVAIIILIMLYCKNCDNFEKIAAGIWGGGILVISGALGTKKKPNSSACILDLNLAFSIVAAATMAAVFILSYMSAYWNDELFVTYLHYTLCGISAFAMVVCIVHSAFCCAATCRPRPVVAVIYENPRTGEQQVLYEDTSGSFLPAPPPSKSHTLPNMPTPKIGRNFLTPSPYEEPLPSTRRQTPDLVKGKPTRAHSVGQEMYQSTERRYIGAANQMFASRPSGRSNYDSIPPSQRLGIGYRPNSNRPVQPAPSALYEEPYSVADMDSERF